MRKAGADMQELKISIHALRKESDLFRQYTCAPFMLFQSTLSVRRATVVAADDVHHRQISIHALRKESDLAGSIRAGATQFQSTLSVRRATHSVMGRRQSDRISIHALRKESDY